MARVDVLMPQMGESIAEGTLSKWLKKLGDEVKRDEPLFEISTDKVDAEIPAPSAGVLAEIKVQEGQTVPVQTLVAVIETDKAAATAAAAAAASPAAPPAAAVTAPPVAAAQRAPATPGGAGPAAAPAPVPRSSSPVPPKGDGAETAEERLRRKSTPLVRKIAAEHQVDISTIPGSGFAGRVTKQDILGFIERGVPVSTPTGTAPRSPLPSVGPVEHPVVEAWPGDRVEPFSKIRKITADHMIMSRRTSAHVTSFFEIDYSRVAELRRKHRAAYSERGDELSLGGLARAINDLGERARSKKLLPDEIQRGTFTITNPGVFGSYAGAPIINQPQVAILGVGAIEKRPKVVTLPDGTDTIAIRTMGMVSMSYDHRVVDGADADRFLADVKRALEDFPEGAI